MPLSGIQFEQWQALWQGYQQFYRVQLSDDVTQQTWSKLTDPQRPYIYGLAAVYQTQVVAIVHVIEHDSCWTLKPYAYKLIIYSVLSRIETLWVSTALTLYATGSNLLFSIPSHP